MTEWYTLQGCLNNDICYSLPRVDCDEMTTESFAFGAVPVSFPAPVSTTQEPPPEFNALYSDAMFSRASLMTVSIELCLLSIVAGLLVMG